MERQKFPFFDLIAEDNLLVYGLSIQVKGPDDQIVDEYDSPDA